MLITGTVRPDGRHKGFLLHCGNSTIIRQSQNPYSHVCILSQRARKVNIQVAIYIILHIYEIISLFVHLILCKLLAEDKRKAAAADCIRGSRFYTVLSYWNFARQSASTQIFPYITSVIISATQKTKQRPTKFRIPATRVTVLPLSANLSIR